MSCENVNKGLVQFLVQEIDSAIAARFYANIHADGYAELIDKGTRVEFGQRTIAGRVQFIPVKYKGYGDYEFVGFRDDSPLNTYHRLLEFDQDEDPERGYGRNPMIIQTYKMRFIAFGNQRLIKEVNFDLNTQVAQDISSLIRQRFVKESLGKIKAQVVAVKPGQINLNKGDVFSKELSPDEIKIKPENILFSIDYEIRLETQNECSAPLCDMPVPVTPEPCPECEECPECPPSLTPSEMTCEELIDPDTGIQPSQIEECFDAITNNPTFIF